MDEDGFEVDNVSPDGMNGRVNEGIKEGMDQTMTEGMNENPHVSIVDSLNDTRDDVFNNAMNDVTNNGLGDGMEAFEALDATSPVFPVFEDGDPTDSYAMRSDELFASTDKTAKDTSVWSNAPTSAPMTAGGVSFDTLNCTMNSTMNSNSDMEMSKNDWPRSPGVRPENQTMWENKTNSNVNQARSLIRQAQQHHQDNERHIHQSHHKHKNQSGIVHNTIKKKIGMTTDLIKALEDRLESIEDTIRQMGECLFQLQRAHRSKWAPLNVCERRLELREGRPIQELVRDHTQEALEHERQTLIESRQELSDQCSSCKETLLALDKLKNEVILDLGHKRHGLRIDRSCLSPVNRPHMSTNQDRVVLPQLHEVSNYQLPPSPQDTQRGTGHHHEESRQTDTKELITRAVRMEEDAMRLCNESDAVMLHTKRECQRAGQQAQASLARRASETDELKKKLENNIRELDEALAETRTSLNRTKKKLEFHEVPLKALDKQFHLRNQRTSREGIRDHVHEELEGQLESVKQSVKTLTAKYQSTRNLLDQMLASRQQLDEDHKNKVTALRIEDLCLKVTPKKAIELDRMDPRGGRCKLPQSARKPKQFEPAFNLSPVSFQGEFSTMC